MKIVLALIIVATLAMAVWVRSLSQEVTRLDKSVQTARAEASEKSTNAALELQAKCSEQSRKAFVELGWSKNQLAGYENHYNTKLNKCFLHIRDTDTKTAPGTIWTSRTVLDAFELKTYASYSWHTEKDKKYWEVRRSSVKSASPMARRRRASPKRNSTNSSRSTCKAVHEQDDSAV